MREQLSIRLMKFNLIIVLPHNALTNSSTFTEMIELCSCAQVASQVWLQPERRELRLHRRSGTAIDNSVRSTRGIQDQTRWNRCLTLLLLLNV